MRAGSRSFVAAILVAAIATLGAPLSARADYCDNSSVIFSWNSANPAGGINPLGPKCILDPDNDFDHRVIYPGSDVISVRYIGDLGETVPVLDAYLTGMGFANLKVELKRGSGVYDSADLTLPQGTGSTGCLSYVIWDPADTEFQEAVDSSVYHPLAEQSSTTC